MYAVITADGTIEFVGSTPTIPRINELVGVEGWARVYPDRQYGACGWVNDCGLLFPDKYPLNATAAVLMAVMGANQQPHNGTMVITGYAFDEWGGPEDLPAETITALQELHPVISKVIIGERPDRTDPNPPGWLTPLWVDRVEEFVEAMRTAPPPRLTFGPGVGPVANQ